MFDKSLTNLIELAQIKPNYMKEKYISVREFLRDYRQIADEKKVYIISNHGRAEGVFIPYDEWLKTVKKKKGERITEESLKPFMFKGADPNISKNIDEILYGSNWYIGSLCNS